MFTFQEKQAAQEEYEICRYFCEKNGVDSVVVNNPCGKCAAAHECPLAGTYVERR